MKARTLAATTLALVVALSTTARADVILAAEGPATDGLLYEAVAKADEFWRDKIGRDAGTPLVCMLSEARVAGRGEQPGRKVWFERDFVRAVRRDVASNDRRARRSAYESLFRVAAHERGHNLGFKHEDLGIMDVNGSVGTPGIGVDWAREKAR